MDYSEYIDDYFNRKLTTEEIKQFEDKITIDQDFAEQVAFYISAKQLLKEEAIKEKKEWFRQLAAQHNIFEQSQKAPVRKMLVYKLSAAAAVLVIIFSAWYFLFNKPVDTQQLADKYIQQKFTTLSVRMGTSLDSVQQALRIYNDGQLDTSLKMFEAIIQKDSSNFEAKKDAGIVYLRLGNYDKALQYFQQLENYTLNSNPAALYHALTIMKRNRPGDREQARQLLQQIVTNDLEGKETAQDWLNKKW